MQKRADAGLNPTPHVSLVAGCRDRSSFLLQALSSWLIALDEDDEIILVDWSTDDRLLSVSSVAELTGNDQRVLTVSVKDQDDWILSRAYNLAAKFASGLNLLKVDCDTVLEADFIQSHPLNESQGNSIFYQTSWKAARNENERHLNGVFYVNRQRFVEVHGYDERLTTYGWDDTDLYSRFKQSGMHSVHMNFEKLHHIQHGDDARGANQQSVDDNPQIETQMNSLALQKLGSWASKVEYSQNEYNYRVFSNTFSRIEAQVTRSARNVLEELSEQERNEIHKLAEDRILHDAYGIPWDFISEFSHFKSDLLRNLHSISTLPNSRWGRGLGVVFLEVSGAAAYRVAALVSALALALMHNRPLIIVWTDFESSKTEFGNLFNTELSGDSSTLLFAMNRVKCRQKLDFCMEWDKMYGSIAEFRSGDDEGMIQRLIDDKLPAKHHLLLRLNDSLAMVPKSEKIKALESLIPSESLLKAVEKYQNVSGSLGIYLGQGLKRKALSAVAQRVGRLAKSRNLFVFVIGTEFDDVKIVRQELNEMSLLSAEEIDQIRNFNQSQTQSMTRELAELYALGMFCKDIINDGKMPRVVAELIDLFRSIRK